MEKSIIINDKKFLLIGIVEAKKDNIYLAYDMETKKTLFFEKKKMLFSKEQFVPANQKVQNDFNDVFNRIEEDLLFLDNNTLNKLDFSKLKTFDIDDEQYNEVFRQTVRNVITNIKELYPECNLDNLNKRIPTLKVSVVEEEKRNYLASFSRWKNEIFISKDVFKSPKLLGNVVCHEIFHLLGTDTEMSKSGEIKKGQSRNTGFEGRYSFGKGINEGFVQKYSNQIIPNNELLTLEVQIADILEIIFEDDLAKENSYADNTKLYSLSKNKEDVIRFIKLVDSYHMLKTRYIDNKKIKDKMIVKYNFISEIEKCLIEFFFNDLRSKIINYRFKTKEEITDRERLFKDELVFMENVNEEIYLDNRYLIDEFDSVKRNFVLEVHAIEKLIEERYIDKKHLKEFYLSKAIKNITKFTFNITDIIEILDESFRKSLNISEKEKVYMIAQKMDNKRVFYIIKRSENNEIEEILNGDIQIMKEYKDAIVYNNLDVSNEAREKERRHTKDRTFSIYRNIDGTFGIADLVDKENRILRALKTLKINIPLSLIDDSLEDFSYLNGYVIPDIDVK